MKLKIDEEADALHLCLTDGPAVESEEVAPGIILDYDADDQVIGVEILYLSKRHRPIDLMDIQLETRRIKLAESA